MNTIFFVCLYCEFMCVSSSHCVAFSYSCHNFWGMDEHTSWQLSKVSYSPSVGPWCCHLCNVSSNFLLSASFTSYAFTFNSYWYNLLLMFRSIIGFLGALKSNSILLWIVSLLNDQSFIFICLNIDLRSSFFLLLFVGHPLTTIHFQYLVMLCIILVAILVFTVLA